MSSSGCLLFNRLMKEVGLSLINGIALSTLLLVFGYFTRYGDQKSWFGFKQDFIFPSTYWSVWRSKGLTWLDLATPCSKAISSSRSSAISSWKRIARKCLVGLVFCSLNPWWAAQNPGCGFCGTHKCYTNQRPSVAALGCHLALCQRQYVCSRRNHPGQPIPFAAPTSSIQEVLFFPHELPRQSGANITICFPNLSRVAFLSTPHQL